MKTLIAILGVLTILSTATSATAQTPQGTQVSHINATTLMNIVDSTRLSGKPHTKMGVVLATKEGVPEVVIFYKDKSPKNKAKDEVFNSKIHTFIALAQVKSNNDPVDVSVGEVYDVVGSPQVEGDVCNLNAKLSFVESGYKIDFNIDDVGREFMRSCPGMVSLQGIYIRN